MVGVVTGRVEDGDADEAAGVDWFCTLRLASSSTCL